MRILVVDDHPNTAESLAKLRRRPREYFSSSSARPVIRGNVYTLESRSADEIRSELHLYFTRRSSCSLSVSSLQPFPGGVVTFRLPVGYVRVIQGLPSTRPFSVLRHGAGNRFPKQFSVFILRSVPMTRIGALIALRTINAKKEG